MLVGLPHRLSLLDMSDSPLHRAANVPRAAVDTSLRVLSRAAARALKDRITTRHGLAVTMERYDLRAQPERVERVRAALLDLLPTCFDPIEGIDRAAQMQHFADYAGRITDPERNTLHCAAFLMMDGATVAAAVIVAVRPATLEGQAIGLASSFGGVRPAYRGHRLLNAGANRMFVDFFKRDRRDYRPLYFLGYVMSPMTFAYILRRVPYAYPSPALPVDPHMERLLQAAVPRRDAAGLIREPVASTRSPTVDAWIEANRDAPDVRWFLKRNPRYAEGYGIPLLVRLHRRDIARAAGRVIRAEGARALRHLIR